MTKIKCDENLTDEIFLTRKFFRSTVYRTALQGLNLRYYAYTVIKYIFLDLSRPDFTHLIILGPYDVFHVYHGSMSLIVCINLKALFRVRRLLV